MKIDTYLLHSFFLVDLFISITHGDENSSVSKSSLYTTDSSISVSPSISTLIQSSQSITLPSSGTYGAHASTTPTSDSGKDATPTTTGSENFSTGTRNSPQSNSSFPTTANQIKETTENPSSAPHVTIQPTKSSTVISGSSDLISMNSDSVSPSILPSSSLSSSLEVTSLVDSYSISSLLLESNSDALSNSLGTLSLDSSSDILLNTNSLLSVMSSRTTVSSSMMSSVMSSSNIVPTASMSVSSSVTHSITANPTTFSRTTDTSTSVVTIPQRGGRGKYSGLSNGGKAALAIFIIVVLIAIAVVGVIIYKRRHSLRWGTLTTSSVAYKRYTDDDGIKMGIYGP